MNVLAAREKLRGLHHDLCWNPSTLEQRTGRVDRIGARAETAGQPIHVYIPFVAETQDEKMYRVVMDRERWFNVLMGEDYKVDARTTERLAGRVPLPASAAEELTFKLGLTEAGDSVNAVTSQETGSGARIDALLRFLPAFEAADANHGEWRFADGVMPHLVTSEAVTEFVQTLYENGWVEPFDWGAWEETAAGYAESPERVATADTDTVRKLLTTHVRKDRFCEGHLVAMIASGHIAAVLRRLRDLRNPAK
jgi:hypothetical protein